MAKELTREEIYELKRQWHLKQAKLPYSVKLDIWRDMRETYRLIKEAVECPPPK